jgi:hypothetical protein
MAPRRPSTCLVGVRPGLDVSVGCVVGRGRGRACVVSGPPRARARGRR